MAELKILYTIDKLAKFSFNNNIVLAYDWDEYVHGDRPTFKRVLKLTLCRISCLLCCIRFGVSTLSDDPTSKIMMADMLFNLNNRRLVSLLITSTALTILLFGCLIQYQEMKGKFHLIKIFNLMAWNEVPVELQKSKEKRLISMT